MHIKNNIIDEIAQMQRFFYWFENFWDLDAFCYWYGLFNNPGESYFGRIAV